MTEPEMMLPPELMGSIERYAVYRCYSDGGELLYVGETGDLGKRFASHAKKLWFVQVRGITLEWYATELEALAAERRAIHVEHPKYNVQHRNSASLRPAASRPLRRSSSRSVKSTARSVRPWRETREIVLDLMREEPGISGSEIGRRLGTTPGFGRTILRRITAEQRGIA